MYIIKNLNNLFTELKKYFEGESFIQEGQDFKLVYGAVDITLNVSEQDENLVVVKDEKELVRVPFNDLESNMGYCLNNIFSTILNEVKVKDFIEGICLKDIHTDKKTYLTDTKNGVHLVSVNELDEISINTNKKYNEVLRESLLDNITDIYTNTMGEITYITFINQNKSYIYKLDELTKDEHIKILNLIAHYKH